MKKILITGGAGFIGSNIAIKLISMGFKVRVLDNLSPQIHGNKPESTSPLYKTIIGKVDFIKGTVTSREDWIKAINGQDAIIHLAAETGTGQSMYEIHRYCDVNIRGTAIMLDILANEKHSIEKIIVASSRSIYGEGKYLCRTHGSVYPNKRNEKDMLAGDFDCKCPLCNKTISLLPTTEDSKIHPNSIYGITKQNQEQMVLLMGKVLGINTVALRYQNVFGPGQSLSNPYTGILSIFSNLILQEKEINIFEDGKESRDFIYIDDVVDATTLCLEKDGANNCALNVGTGIPIDVENVTKTLLKNYSSQSNYRISGNYRIGDIRHNFADTTMIEKTLGFKHKVSFSEGILSFTNWVKQQKIIPSLYETAIEEMKNKNLFK
ncbi:NAD-dependent epimerase/dehydratase family protein [Roseimarinus sediminis]|uniref:NAD-dependent epimerase/dehydratase family protein n=1 Tax=Roseimarinus sediminis TaxID=1610899 RepID=UPI003D19F54F